MISFLIASLFSLLIFQLSSHVFIRKDDDGVFARFHGMTIWLEGYNKYLSKLIFLCAVFLFVIVTVCLIAASFDLTSRWLEIINLQSFVVGLIFGPLLSIWLDTIIRNAPGESLSRLQAVALVGLLVLVALGAFGRDAKAWLGRYSNKVSEVSALGIGVKFSILDSDRVLRQESEANFVSAPAQSQGSLPLGASTSGLLALAQLEAFIGRDCDLIAFSYREQDASRPRKPIGCPDDAFDGAPYFLRAKNFSKILIADHAKCFQKIYEKTSDTDFVDGLLRKLISPMRELSSPVFIDNNFAPRAAAILHEVSTDVVRYLYPAFVVGKLQDQDNKVAKGTTWEDFEVVGDECLPMMLIACNIDTSTLSGEKQVPWKNFIKDKKFVDLLRRCGAALMARNMSDLGLWEAIRYKISVEASIRKSEATIRRFLQIPKAGAGFSARPYVSIAYAGLAASVKNYEAAAQVLTEWLNERGVSSNSNEATSKGPMIWIHIRARAVMLNIVEEWLRDLGDAAPVPLREQHLANAAAIARLYEDTSASRAIIEPMLRRPSAVDLKQMYFVPSASTCRLPEKDMDRALYIYLSARQIYIYNLLKYHDLDIRHLSGAITVVEEVLNADLSCISRSYGREFGKILRADSLDLYSRVLIKYARVLIIENKSKSSEVSLKIEAAHSALHQAQVLVREIKKEDDEERAKSRVFSKRVVSNPVSDTWSSLNRTSRELDAVTKGVAAIQGRD